MPHRPPLVLLFLSTALTNAGEIKFNRDIRPILSDKCFHCHGPDAKTREAKLRLDTPEGSRKGGAIEPGDPDDSEVIYRILSQDEDEIMPPPDSHKTLSEKEIGILQQWIEEGAEYEGQWIYQAPAKVTPPKVDNGTLHTPVDNFIQSRLHKEGHEAAPEAERMRLIRRLSFDLTGLPPSPEEVQTFVQDQRPDAYDRLIDRLLESPAYGERMAVKWLDLVRYADTVGFHGDQNISQSPYRDYVIDAFNSNMPFDRFTREQLAGDLLPNPTLSQKVASGYNRLNMTTEEGGAQPKEYLAKYAGDRVRNTSVVWLGATIGCAECHDHKFDPYTSKDFYAFSAFFADLDEVGKYSARRRPPEIPVPTPNQQALLVALNDELAPLRKVLDTDTPEIVEARKEWVIMTKASFANPDEAPSNDHFLIEDKISEGDEATEGWHFVQKEEHPPFRGSLSRKQESKGLTQHILSLGSPRELKDGAVFFTHVYLDQDRCPETLMLQLKTSKGWNHRSYWGADKVVYGGIGKESPDHHRHGDLPATGQWVRLEVPASEIGLGAGDKITGMAFTQFGGKVWWDDSGIHGTTNDSGLPPKMASIIRGERPSDDQLKELADYFRSTTPLLETKRAEFAAVDIRHKALMESIPTMPVSQSVKPRTIRVLPRGNWMDESGEVVQAAIPEFLGEIKPSGNTRKLTRLDLANWITSRDNPMTARVFVNNLWHQFFGTGISNVLSDLGNQGEPPFHPELLDWLALEFADSGWDIQHVVKLIVRSHAYRQSSMPPEDLKEFDPYNRLLSVQSRRRLSAEMVRDNALKISGLLNPKIGGPSVHPYQPTGYYAQLNFPRRTYQHSRNENQFRRALYTHWQRTFLHPALMAFDAPAREACTAQRPVSNTPLQALVLMNDPSYVEAARYFAERMISEGGDSPESRIEWAYREALSRPPSARESAVLLEIHKKHRSQYEQSPADAKALLSVGLEASDTTQTVDLAAWTSVARIILNLHELITRL